MADVRSETPLLVVFVDLTRFWAQSQRVDDAELAEALDAYYEQVGTAVRAAGGRIVKFLGDGVLIVFAEDRVDPGVEMLLALKDAVDRSMAQRGWECRLIAKAHFGTVIAGPFGVTGDKRHDVVGKTVNIAATLEATGVTLSVAAFRKLSAATRKHFKRHTPPISYIRMDDRRHRGRAGSAR
jgi:adenylate cyclase